MPITQRFLGWNRPALQSAADLLVEQYTIASVTDLSGVVVVLPGARAGRRLMELLVEGASRRDTMLLPPETRTVGSLPELLYEPKLPFADELTQQLAWVSALKQFDRDRIASVIRQLPADDDTESWIRMGELLRRQHRELAADGLDFSQVARHMAGTESDAESERWTILREVQQAYLRTLDELELWDRQTARLFAIRERECQTDQQIVLIATVDMDRAMRQMLDQVAGQVTAMIFAPHDWSERFDTHGCLIAEAWQDVELNLSSARVHVARGPAEQADAAVRCIADYNGAFRADEIAVGVPDEKIVPQLERRMGQSELPCRFGPGKPVAASGPYRLLQAVAAYVERGRFADFATLVRHPDMDQWFASQNIRGDWLAELDQYYNDHLPSRLNGEWLGAENRSRRIQSIYDLVRKLFAPLEGSRALNEWAAALFELLMTIYGARTLDPTVPHQRVCLRACQTINDALSAHQFVPASLAPAVSATEAIQLTLAAIRSAAIAPPTDEAAIELLGWLELPLDDAPALIVTSLNEGFVPKSVNSDLFLPNGLRSQLQLDDNARRYARDAYALTVLLETRTKLDLIVGRIDSDANPLVPSRLLFAADQDTVAERVLEFFGPSRNEESLPAPLPRAVRDESNFPIPRPLRLDKPIEKLSVTTFRTYLACPYRFYLGRVLYLEQINDNAEELDGGTFGTLIHEVLQRFGSGPGRDSTDAKEISEILNQELHSCVRSTYGTSALAPVAIQVEQMRARLEGFARKQAEWAESGWRIEYVESADGALKVPFVVDDRPFTLRGKIDRIDVHRDSGKRVIFDYKSSDSPNKPESTHQKRGEWIDLQLPLYRHLATALEMEGPFQFGYIVLPKDTTKTDMLIAPWGDDDLAAADEVARDVIRKIRDERFWPPADPPPKYSEEFASICQDTVL